MGQTVVRRVEQRRGHKARDWMFLAAAALILIFAAVGVVSAAGYVGGKVATSPAKTHTHHTVSTSNAAALQDVARAQAQATAIIKAAQTAGKSIVNADTKKAHRQASAIVAKARASNKSRVAAVVPTPTAAPVSGSQATAPSAASGSSASSGAATSVPGSTSGYGAASSSPAYGSTSGTAPSASASTSGGTAPSTSAPNLGSVPATWLVVAYNATFGHGPGNAGSIAVINRSKFAFSGVARVNYIGSSGLLGSAYAPFSGLAPGQSEILPLNGMTYPAGAIRYQIEVTNVH